METEFFSFMTHYAPFVAWIFSISMIPQIVRNFRNKKYASGPRLSWCINTFGNMTLGTYMFMKHENIIASHMTTATVLCLVILLQSFIYEHALQKAKA